MDRRKLLLGAGAIVAPYIIRANAQVPLTGAGTGVPTGSVSGGGGGPATTWDPTKAFNVAFSNGNLTITNTNGSPAFGNTRTTTSHSSGKFYAEFTITAEDFASAMGIGVCNSSFTFANHTVGFDTNSIAQIDNLGANYNAQSYIMNNSETSNSIGKFNPTHVVGMAVDIGNATIWWRLDGGNWNASGSDNPATNTGGISIAGIGTPLWIAAEVETNAEIWTANFGGSAFSFTAPVGFGNW